MKRVPRKIQEEQEQRITDVNSDRTDPEDEDSDFNLMKYLTRRSSTPRDVTRNKQRPEKRHFAKKYLHETDGITADLHKERTRGGTRLHIQAAEHVAVTDSTIQLQKGGRLLPPWSPIQTRSFLQSPPHTSKASSSSSTKEKTKSSPIPLLPGYHERHDLYVESVRKSNRKKNDSTEIYKTMRYI